MTPPVPAPTHTPPPLAFAPWRLSGTVLGALLNDPAQLAALGDAVHAPPYKAPPQAPVLQVKPRNTLAASGAAVSAPAEPGLLEIGATLGIVIGRAACGVSEADARAHVAGWLLVADLFVPHTQHYRPNVRLRARDASCLLGAEVLPCAALAEPDAVAFGVSVEGGPPQRFAMAPSVRPVARLLRDVSAFMTLHPGDVLLLGTRHGAPVARIGQHFSVDGGPLGRLTGQVVAEAA